jgi:DNA-binding LytR/AlgR family response regulator
MIRCLAIDDETLALDLLEDNIRKVPFLQLVRRCSNGFEALEALKQEQVDLIFLDIRMPDLSGIQMLKVLPRPPLVIFTTAFEHYALEGFDLDVIDYLLKPFSFERFLRAVNKAKEYLAVRDQTFARKDTQIPPAPVRYLFVKSDYKLVKIDLEEILYIEGLKDYIKIYTGERPVITQMSMKAIEEKLPHPYFLRVHRSFMVNVRKIQFIERGNIRIGNREIPISGNYRDTFLKVINPEKPSE